MTVFQVVFQPFGIANTMRWRAYIPIGCTLFLRIVLLSQKTTYMYLLGSASSSYSRLFFRCVVFLSDSPSLWFCLSSCWLLFSLYFLSLSLFLSLDSILSLLVCLSLVSFSLSLSLSLFSLVSLSLLSPLSLSLSLSPLSRLSLSLSTLSSLSLSLSH